MSANITELLKRIEFLEDEIKEMKSSKMNTFDIQELAKRTGYKVPTLHKKVSLMTNGIHFFKPNGGKLLFSESAVSFLIKGENKSNGKSIRTKRQPVSLDKFLS